MSDPSPIVPDPDEIDASAKSWRRKPALGSAASARAADLFADNCIALVVALREARERADELEAEDRWGEQTARALAEADETIESLRSELTAARERADRAEKELAAALENTKEPWIEGGFR